MEFEIRQGKREDLKQVFELIKELAEYENGLEQVTNTVEAMERDGFGQSPIFGFFVAQSQHKLVGLALYYFRYSTWKGKRLYLEDIVVTRSCRGRGIGKLLFEQIIRKAREEKCTGMMWQVLDWNEPAINFYKKYDTQFDSEWLNCHIDFS